MVKMKVQLVINLLRKYPKLSFRSKEVNQIKYLFLKDYKFCVEVLLFI